MRYGESNNTLKPGIAFVFLIDETGGQTFTSAGGLVTWDLTKILTKHFRYTSDTNSVHLRVNTSGLYKVMFHCCYAVSSANLEAMVWVYKNGVVETNSKIHMHADVGKHTMLTLDYVIYLEYGDYIQIYVDTTAGTLTSMANTNRLIIEGLPMGGWNNNAGGREKSKSGVF